MKPTCKFSKNTSLRYIRTGSGETLELAQVSLNQDSGIASPSGNFPVVFQAEVHAIEDVLI